MDAHDVTRVLVLNDGARERELRLVGRIVVGRDPSCEISHDDSLLSRRHAEFVSEREVTTVRDLGSRNGVFVNGARVVECVLEAGDVVQIGPLRARLVQIDAGVSEAGGGDGERTAVLRRIFAGAAPAALDDDEETTRMVPAPAMPAAIGVLDDDAEATRFIARDAGADPRAATAGLAPAPEPAARALRDGDRLRGFIFGQVAMLAALVFVASGLPLFVWRQSAAGTPVSAVWILLPAVAALVGAYIVGTSIAGRVHDAVTNAERSRR